MYQGGEKIQQSEKQIKLSVICDNEEQKAEMLNLLNTLKLRMYEKRTCNALHKTLQALILGGGK